MISTPASSRSRVIAMRWKGRSASSGLSDRHHPEKVIVFTGIRKLMMCAVEKRRERKTSRRFNIGERYCKASALSRPGNRLGSVAWQKRPKSCNPQQATEGRASWIRLELNCPKASFERRQRKHQGKWIETLTTVSIRLKSSA